MKQILHQMADYNQKAGEVMLSAIATAPVDLPGKHVGAYFGSIDGIVEHMAWANALWLQRYASFGSYACLASSGLVGRDLAALREDIKGDRAKAADLLRDSAALLSRFVAELPDADFGRRVRYRTTDGDELERTYWHCIFQVLNHGTHHRGEVYVILDQQGVANDFNSFVAYVP